MIKSGKFITALLLSSALICAAIPSQSLQAQTVTITKEAISDDLYCVTELVETSGSGIQPFSATQTKSGSKTQRYVNSSGTTLWYVTVHAFTARAIEGISDMGIIRGSSGAADTDYDRLFLDGKEQKFYEYKGEKVYLSVEYAWSHDSIVSGI
jgi:hypothetical protein